MRHIHKPVYYVPMPVNAKGMGPEMDETKVAHTQHEVWDQTHSTICVCMSKEIAETIVRAINKKGP
jgi:hypothetical protein